MNIFWKFYNLVFILLLSFMRFENLLNEEVVLKLRLLYQRKHTNRMLSQIGFEPIMQSLLLKMQLMYEQHITVFVLSQISFI